MYHTSFRLLSATSLCLLSLPFLPTTPHQNDQLAAVWVIPASRPSAPTRGAVRGGAIGAGLEGDLELLGQRAAEGSLQGFFHGVVSHPIG